MAARQFTVGTLNPLSMTSDTRWVPCKNMSGEEIPPYSVARLSAGTKTAEDEGGLVYVEANQPNDETAILALTGPQAIPIDAYGVCTQDSPAWMAYDEANGVPAAGEKYTSDTGAWTGRPAGTDDREDFTILGPVVDDEDPTRVLVIQHNLGEVGDPGPESGCCGACVDDALLTIDDLYAEVYTASRIPPALGGPTITLNYIGLMTPSPLSQLTEDNLYYWESDSFTYTYNGNSDDYIWRLMTDADGTSTCRAGTGLTVLYLVRVASATTGTDLTAPRCDPGGGLTFEFVQYETIQDWRARCGTKFYLRFPQFQQREIEALLSCAVCVTPFDPSADNTAGGGAADIAYADLDACWKSILDTMGATTLPGSLYIKLNTLTAYQDAASEDYLENASTNLWRLDFDTGDMKYYGITATTAPDCAGSGTDPDKFKRPAAINPDSTLGTTTPEYPDPLVYFEISCVDATTIQVKTLSRKDWEVSNDGSSHACTKTVNLTISTGLAGTFTNYLHAERGVDIKAGKLDWELET